MLIGERIKAIRTEKGISQKQLAEQTGISVNAIQSYEYGKYKPKSATIRKIAKALGVSTSDIDEELNDLFQKWNEQYLPEIKAEEALCECFPAMEEEDYTAFQKFLSLDSEGKQKALEYIDLLMLKYKKADTHSNG